ncbi:nucleotidyltransferase family protein [Rhizobium sp. C1]|uniref:nucleotidyltransferase family protein n=1 Tax=Rhizobium sp. C1 TaxID=1349799 RepID=UPI001E2C10F5|nr:nucleotidyltransferase family protein [Rhizobium sp. C1]MCD2178529.1 nucleotidyltransferase family protein [Rhizobium sp. C1]
MKIDTAMVLAAGLGTRLRPITDTMPKPLVPIAGKPMIDYVLNALAEAGVEEAVVNVHHLADQMEAHLARRARPRVQISDERESLLDSGGGLVRGMKLLPRQPLFVMNADLFWVGEKKDEPSNLSRLAGFFEPERMDIAMLVVRNEDTTGHNGKLDFSLGEDGRLSRYKDGLPRPVVYAGAFVLAPELLDDAPDGPFGLNASFDKAIAAGRLFGLELSGHWITVGTPDAIAPAEAAVARFAASGG